MINKLTRHLGQKYRGDHRPRTQPQLLANMLHLSSDGNFIHSSAGRPWMFVSLHTRYWAGPFPLHCWNPGQNWPTQLYLTFSLCFSFYLFLLHRCSTFVDRLLVEEGKKKKVIFMDTSYNIANLEIL